MTTRDINKFRATQKRYRDKKRRERSEALGRPLKTVEKHGKCNTPTWVSWRSMIQRCTDPKSSNYKFYGGRGIGICDLWRSSFKAFLDDMGERPLGHTLDRKDPNGDYELLNCRWATKIEQMNNCRSNRIICIGAQEHTAAEWGRLYGIPAPTIWDRLNRGWSAPDAVSRPLRGT